MTKTIYAVLGEDPPMEDSLRHPTSVSKVAKEARLIPNLIFQVEQYDVGVLRLSKQARGSGGGGSDGSAEQDLSVFVVPSLNRDFKIKKSPKKKKQKRSKKQHATQLTQAT